MTAGREERSEWEGGEEGVREENGDGKLKRERDSDRGIREMKETDLGKESSYRTRALGKKDRKWREMRSADVN